MGERHTIARSRMRWRRWWIGCGTIASSGTKSLIGWNPFWKGWMDNMSTIAESTRSVVVERVFAHAPAKVWRALTESPLIAQWLMKNDFELTVGKRFQLRSEPVPNWDGVIDCEVTVV